MTNVSERRGVLALWIAAVLVIACSYALVIAPQRYALRGALEIAAAESQKTDQIRATLRHAVSIRRARAEVIARLGAERRGQRSTIEHILELLDRDARDHAVSIVAIAPGNSAHVEGSKASGAPADIDLTISTEGTFEETMRFLEEASSSVAMLDIGDVRLSAERRAGNTEVLLAQIEARAYRFEVPK
jgi:hypothetical protein